MNLSEKHPQFTGVIEDYTLMAHAIAGQRVVKAERETYLPSTSGHRALGMNNSNQDGWKLYDAYLKRAFFPEITKDTVAALAGAITREPATITLPKELEEIREAATPRGESLEVLHKRIIQSLLSYGRRGLLLDIDASRDLPYIADYSHAQIINWDDTNVAIGSAERKLLMVVLDESRQERVPGSTAWKTVKRYRLLSLGEFQNEMQTDTFTSMLEVDGIEGESITPSLAGSTLDEIPFTFINCMDLSPKIDDVPLLGLANLNMAIYRGEADYRQTLFMTGQDTLVLTGVPSQETNGNEGSDQGADVVIGAGAMIRLADNESDAKFIGVTGNGIAEQRESLVNDYARAADYGMRLLSGGSAESTETIRMRVAGKTANLVNIAMTAAAGLERSLKQAAVWRGVNPDDVSVEPNTDFVEDRMLAQDLLHMVTAKHQGAPLSWRSMHAQMRKRDMTDLTFEEELKVIAGEADLSLGTDRDLAGEPDQERQPDNNQE